MKTMPATIQGRYVAQTKKEWNAFEASDGKAVEAGRSITLHVVSDAGQLYSIRANSFAREIDQLTFATPVVVDCEARPYRGELAFTALSLNVVAAKS